jgi:hypothetical protein
VLALLRDLAGALLALPELARALLAQAELATHVTLPTFCSRLPPCQSLRGPSHAPHPRLPAHFADALLASLPSLPKSVRLDGKK